MNASFARSVTLACLSVFGGMCLLIAGLLGVLLVVSFLRGDGPNPAATFLAGALFGAVGLGCPRLAKWLA